MAIQYVISPAPSSYLMHRLRSSLEVAPIVDKDGYEYFVHPISDGVPMLDPGLLREVAIRIIRVAEIDTIDKIVTPAAMGIHISAAVSLLTDIPLVVIRKRSYGLAGEVEIAQETGYGSSPMFINDVAEGDRVLIIDDVLSTGGTVQSIFDGLAEIGATVVDAVAVIEKVDESERPSEVDAIVTSLIEVRLHDGQLEILGENGINPASTGT